MRSLMIVFACMLLLACAHATQVGDDVVVTLPRPPAAGERIVLEIELGVLGAGEEIVLRTPDGRLIGTASPHGIRPGNAAGTYVVPVPPEIAAARPRRDRLSLRILVERAGAPVRTARGDEVLSVRAVVLEHRRQP